MKRFTNALKITTMAVAAASLMATSAMATEGLFGNGTGARAKALAGAGVANEKDATAISSNPAGLVHADNQLSISASLFSPNRSYDVGGGVVDSDSNYFVIPNIAYSHRVDSNTVFGLSMYGNGGMNTDYPVNFAQGFNPALSSTLGIDLTQIFISAAVAKQYGNLSIGIAPILGIQIFEADGVPDANFAVQSGNKDIAAGIGLRAGIEWAVSSNFRVAVAGATPTYFQAFTSYDEPNQLFGISNGVLDVPGTIQAGIAFDAMPNLTVMADYKRIFYSGVEAIGSDPSLGGFGWSDINVYKVAMEWEVVDDFTLRAGYAYNDQPLSSAANAFFGNILAPATVQHHFTAGAMFEIADDVDMEIAGMYAPRESVATPGDATTGTPASRVSMYQWELTAGIKWELGEKEEPLK